MNDTLSKEKTYTCGWCHRQHIPMTREGFLMEHVKPGTVSTICRGQETYNLGGRSK